ncbi:hypothetical protein CRG98_026276 [Punica granatum]|uniref:Pentatricopeptide repeat-containing protein At1g26500 n=1 Tax=Punica granatum TaxID=22663 RepID=A0A2I0JAR0_PUNGR|nr:hypothetical protein CRG98_026276 [Punica granatum]
MTSRVLVRRLLNPQPRLVPFLRPLTTESAHPSLPAAGSSAADRTQLLRVCTILFQQQHSPDSRLHAKLLSAVHSPHSRPLAVAELFLQVCNTFPLSWRPVYRFYQFTRTLPDFSHSTVTLNKMLDVIGKSRNIDLFWDVLNDMAHRRLVNDKTFNIALKTLAQVRELNKCVQFFHLMNENGWEYKVETLNRVVETLCRAKLADEAKFLVFKLKEWVQPNEVIYGWLIKGFCDAGDLIEASRVWNLMVDQGFEPDIHPIESVMETLFKTNRYGEALKLFQMMRVRTMEKLGLSTYRLVIGWLCKGGKVAQACAVFDELHKRGIEADNLTISSLVYGHLSRGQIREAYSLVQRVEEPDISVYHGLIKGLLKLKRASEATEVFREMARRGCEPIMHTYVMLLQGHFGKRGRRGPDSAVNFDSIFVGGLVKAGKSLEATKFVERVTRGGVEVPRFDYNKFLHHYSNEDGVVMFEEVSHKLRDAGMIDLAYIFERYGQKMATRDRRRDRGLIPQGP